MSDGQKNQKTPPRNLQNFSNTETSGFNMPFADLANIFVTPQTAGDDVLKAAASAQPGFAQRQLSHDALLGEGRPAGVMSQDGQFPEMKIPRLDRARFNSNLGDIPSKDKRKWVAK